MLPPWLLLPANNSAVEELKIDNRKAVLSTDERWIDADSPKPYLFQSQHFCFVDNIINFIYEQ